MYDKHIDPNRGSLIVWMVLLAAYSFLLYDLSSGVVAIPGPSFPHMDKVAHAGAYGLMALLAWQAFRHWVRVRHGAWAWLYTVVYGATDEWHQSYVPGRYADIWDWVADIAGATLALLLLKVIARFWYDRDWDADTKAPL